MLTKAQAFDPGLVELADLAKALSHPARLAILEFLASQDTCICGEIVEQLPLAQATVSRHLKVLREAGLISVTQKGVSSCYCIDGAAVSGLRSRLDAFFRAVEEGAVGISC